MIFVLEGIIKELSVYLKAPISVPFHIKIEFPISQLEQDSHFNQSLEGGFDTFNSHEDERDRLYLERCS